MTIGRFGAERDRPFFWWGATERRDPAPELGLLIDQEAMRPVEAATLIVMIERGLSLFVISEASGSGKSTLLSALLEAASTPRSRIYLRGNYESFGFLADTDARHSLLLVNEISPHLPAYLWGPGVRQVMECMKTGYQVLGTAHAESGPALVHLLTSAPLRVPALLAMQPYAVVQLADPDQRTPQPLQVTSIGGIVPGNEPGTFHSLVVDRGAPDEPLIELASRLLRVANLDSAAVSEAITAANQVDRAGRGRSAE